MTPGQLTLATDNPPKKPWWNGPATRAPWKGGNPYTAKGYESAVAYAIAKRLGFSGRQVSWVPVTEAQALQPGSKPFDFYLGQVTYGSVRDRDVDFSYGYYSLPIAFLARRTNPYSKARNLAILKRRAYFGLVAGTTGHRYVNRWIKPSQGPIYYDTYESALSGLAFGQVSGIATDLPTAYVLRPRVAGGGVIVGQFPKKGTAQRFALVFAQGSKLRGVREQGARAAHEPRDDQEAPGALAESRRRTARASLGRPTGRWYARRADSTIVSRSGLAMRVLTFGVVLTTLAFLLATSHTGLLSRRRRHPRAGHAGGGPRRAEGAEDQRFLERFVEAGRL